MEGVPSLIGRTTPPMRKARHWQRLFQGLLALRDASLALPGSPRECTGTPMIDFDVKKRRQTRVRGRRGLKGLTPALLGSRDSLNALLWSRIMRRVRG